MSDFHGELKTPSVSCPLCQSPKSALAFTKRGFDIYRCPSCGCFFVWPRPKGFAEIYSEDYFRGARRGFGYVDYERDKLAMRSYFETVLDLVERFAPSRGRLLDVGAATGFFMKLAISRGWQAEGIEVSDYAVRQAKFDGLRVHQGALEDVAFSPAPFQVITLLDVIEHLADPASALKKCVRAMIPGGLIAINTPDTSSLWAHFFGRKWHAFLPPEHLSYFNPQNLTSLVTRAGLRVVGVARIGKRFTPAYVASILYRWQGFEFWRRLAMFLEVSPLNRITLPLHIRDNFFLIAAKPANSANERRRA